MRIPKKNRDAHTMKIIKYIGEEIFNFIKLTTDIPANYENNYIPMLDIQCKVQNNKIMYKFYEKPMNSKFVIPYKSAHSHICKISTLVQEAVRRNLRTSMLEDYNVRDEIMSEYSLKLYRSGYPEHMRSMIISRVINIYNTKLRNVMITPDTSLYRDPKDTKLTYRLKAQNKNIYWCIEIERKRLKDDFEHENTVIAPLILNQEYINKIKKYKMM